MGVIVRSWNLFHGNAYPPQRHGHLREMVELAAADRPAVLCLQEVPVWALGDLAQWSGMTAVTAVTRRPLWPAAASAWLTRKHQGLLRSAIAGQANATLAGPERTVTDLDRVRISDARRERRLVLVTRVEGVGVVANLHASNEFTHPDVPATELERARDVAESHARSDELVLLVGDFNLHGPALEGYTEGGPGIDHILVRGSAAGPLTVWPPERRTRNGLLLSDHAPVEREVG